MWIIFAKDPSVCAIYFTKYNFGKGSKLYTAFMEKDPLVCHLICKGSFVLVKDPPLFSILVKDISIYLFLFEGCSTLYGIGKRSFNTYPINSYNIDEGSFIMTMSIQDHLSRQCVQNMF